MDATAADEAKAVCAAPTEDTRARYAIFSECPHCGSDMAPEHAHYRCTSCGWRDSCCD